MTNEVVLKFAAKHDDIRAIGIMLKRVCWSWFGNSAGLSGFAGARPKPSPVVRLFSFLIPKSKVPIKIIDENEYKIEVSNGEEFDSKSE